MMYCDNSKCNFFCEDGKVPKYCPKCHRGSFSRPKGFGLMFRRAYYIITGPFYV
jgi:hypothetical protein